MSGSTVPQVISALVAAFPGTPFIGEPPQAQPGDFISVAWAGPENAAVVMTQAISGARLQLEQYTVTSQVVAWEGKTTLLDCITRAYDKLDTIATNLIADKTLGGACMQATLSGSELSLDQTGKGALAILSVHVAVEAYRR